MSPMTSCSGCPRTDFRNSLEEKEVLGRLYRQPMKLNWKRSEVGAAPTSVKATARELWLDPPDIPLLQST